MKTLTKTITAVVSIGALGALIGTPSAVAGDRGWATAGKILTGVVVADVLFNHLPADRYESPRVVEHTTVYTSAPSATYVEYRTYQPRVYSPPPVSYSVTYSSGYCPPPRPVVVYSPVYCPPPVYRYAPVYHHGSSVSVIYQSGWGHGGHHGDRPFRGHAGGGYGGDHRGRR